MALIPIRVDLTSKPPLGTPLRTDGHWAVQGLVGAWAFNEGAGATCFDATGNNYTNVKSGGVLRDINGITATSAGYYQAVKPLLNPQNGKWSIVTRLKVPSGAAICYPIFHTGGDGGTTASLRTRDTDSFYWFFDGYNSASWTSGIAIDQVGWHTWALTRSSATTALKLARDGVDCGAPTQGILSATNTWSAFSRFGAHQDGNGFDVIEFAYFYETDLTPQQIASLSANPWQIYEPEVVWVDAGAGSAPGLAYPTGVSSASATGTATAKGKGTKAVSGVGTAASVGTATATGKGKTNATGVSTTASVGTATASHNAGVIHYATPTGVSATASVGTATSKGKATISTTGVSTASSVGTATATHSGQGLATPIGVGATALVGSVYCNGKARITITGQIVVSSVGSVVATGTSASYDPEHVATMRLRNFNPTMWRRNFNPFMNTRYFTASVKK